MASKIDVESGNPYRTPEGHFGTSPDAKLKAAIAAVQGKKFVSHDDNKKKVASAKKDAEAKLAALRGGKPASSNFNTTDLYDGLPDSYARTLDDEKEVGDLTLAQYYHDKKHEAGSLISMTPDDYLQALVDHTESGQNYKTNYDSVDDIKARTNMDNVAKYAEAMRNGDVFDIPALLFDEDGYIEGQEGIHRTFAAKEVGLETIPVYVRYNPTKPPVDFYEKHGDNIIKGYDARKEGTDEDAWVTEKAVDTTAESRVISDDQKQRIHDTIFEFYDKPSEEKHKMFEKARQIAGVKNDSPATVEEYSKGTSLVYRAADKEENKTSMTSWKKWKEGLYGETDSGLYLTPDKETAAGYGSTLYEFGLQDSAKLLEQNGPEREKIIEEAATQYKDDFSKRVMIKDILTRDSGMVSLLGGYDGFIRGSGNSREIVLVNRSVLEELNGDAPKVAKKKENALAINANITPDQQRQIDLATEQFKQSVQRVDNQILAQYVQAVQDGDYAKAEAILANAQESQQVSTLTFAMLTIGVILLPLYARQRLNKLFVEFALYTVFANTDDGQKALRQQAEKGAKSHVQTIAKDLKNSLDDAIDNELTNPDIEAAVKDKFEELVEKDSKAYLAAVHKDENIYKFARDLILKGESRNNVIKKLQENFSAVGKRRAQVIAGNESNRIFTLSQFEADAQFLAQNKLTDKAYKRLISNTGTPEALCRSIIEKTAAEPIPFKQDFIPFNKNYSYTGDDGKPKKFKASYEHLKGGTIHVNCHCRYELLIKQDDGTFLNTYTWKVENFFDIDSEDRYDDEPCECCGGTGEHDTGRECYGCDASGLAKDFEGDMPCEGTKEDNALGFDEKKHKRDKDGKFAKKAGTKDKKDDKKAGKTLDLSRIADLGDFNEFIEEAYWDGTFGDYDQKTSEAVRAYQGHYYDAINMRARANDLDKPLTVYGEDTTYGETIDKINSAANISLASNAILYRGTTIPYHKTMEVGEVIHSRSFLSTSVDHKVSVQFQGRDDGSMLIITAKKGQKVILPDLLTFGKRGRTMGEAEVLMPTGSSLTITRIDGDIVYAELN